jgi:uncharacterized protein YjaG (DUF416 family)
MITAIKMRRVAGRHCNLQDRRTSRVKTFTLEAIVSQPASVTNVTFAIHRQSGKIVAVKPVVDSDEELRQVNPWIDACLILSDLIRPAANNVQKAA